MWLHVRTSHGGMKAGNPNTSGEKEEDRQCPQQHTTLHYKTTPGERVFATLLRPATAYGYYHREPNHLYPSHKLLVAMDVNDTKLVAVADAENPAVVCGDVDESESSIDFTGRANWLLAAVLGVGTESSRERERGCATRFSLSGGYTVYIHTWLNRKAQRKA